MGLWHGSQPGCPWWHTQSQSDWERSGSHKGSQYETNLVPHSQENNLQPLSRCIWKQIHWRFYCTSMGRIRISGPLGIHKATLGTECWILAHKVWFDSFSPLPLETIVFSVTLRTIFYTLSLCHVACLFKNTVDQTKFLISCIVT